jgi:uncharacterized protein YbjT (DUF2867 family)
MKVTVTGSLGNISRPLTEKLVASGHEISVVSSNPDRAEEITKLGATALIGSVEDYEFIRQSFEGRDAVYLMIPPSFTATDLNAYIQRVGKVYAHAITETGVKWAVNLSSLGSHIQNGLGPTGSNFQVEQRLNELADVHVLHLRPGMFMTNFYGAIPMIKYQGMLGNNFAGSVSLPLTHPEDIAQAAFQAIDQMTFSGKKVQYVISDERTGFEIADLLGEAIGKTGVKWIEFSDGQLLNALLQNGFSEQMAKVYMVEIGIALRDGSFSEDFRKHRHLAVGVNRFEKFAGEFAAAYRGIPI